MTYTTQQLQEMEDAEINEAIAKKLGMVINSYCGDAVMCGYEGLRSTFADRDYCNNPSDIMQLAFESGIYYYNGTAFTNIIDYIDDSLVFDEPNFFYPKNPLRAIACLLLMMEG